MKQNRLIRAKAKLALGIGLLGLVALFAPGLFAGDGSTCTNCSPYNGLPPAPMGDCTVITSCSICDNGTCCYTNIDCHDGSGGNPGLSCTC